MSISITLPEPPPKRDHIFGFRLTSDELNAIRVFAHALNVSPSHLVRHFLMQSVEHYREEKS